MRAVSARDEYAADLARSLAPGEVSLAPDPALMLPPADRGEADDVLAACGIPLNGAPLVGVAVRRWFHHTRTLVPHKYALRWGLREVPGAESCDRLTSLLARVLDGLAERHGAFIVLLPTYNVSHESDDGISLQVLRKMRSGRGGMSCISDPRLYKAVCGRLRVMLGGRMHPTIFAAAMGTPVVGLSYNRKFEGFFRHLGRESDVIPIEEFVHREKVSELSELLSRCIEGRAKPPAVGPLIEKTRRFTERILERAS
jgi:polysaccharide pyruvyl transferase WcaK-like protein